MVRTEDPATARRGAVVFVVFTLISTALLLGLLEAAVRIAFPFVHRQGTDSRLLRRNGVGESVGWVPGARGTSFDAVFEIDERGFRRIAEPVEAAEALVLLGDSVTAGVGVPAQETFAGLLQARNPNVRVVDTAVIGYSIDDYVTVLRELLDRGEPIRRAVAFLCLNDVAERMVPETARTSIERARYGLRDGSVLYQWLKGILTDRSLVYYQDVEGRYAAANPDWERLSAGLAELDEIAARHGIALGAVLLPYEAQLRGRVPDRFAPQRMILARLAELGIPALDLAPAFAAPGLVPATLFLWKDAMHLSPDGHRLTAGAVGQWLAREMAGG